jgi:hypothetical protein
MKTRTKLKGPAKNGARRETKTGTSPGIVDVLVKDIRPALVNDEVYGITNPDSPALDELVKSMANQGQLEPVVLTQDNVLLSGHRRLAAAKWLKWKTLKARFEPIFSNDPDFERLLVSYNAQRDKSPDVRVREQLVLVDPDEAYGAMTSERARASKVTVETLHLGARRRRSRISAAKGPFLEAIQQVITDLEEYWPLSDRRIHYALLNHPPLIHASKPDSLYRNDHKCYKAVCELLTRARLTELIPWQAIGDETRPVTTWAVDLNVAPFLQRQVRKFCTGPGGPPRAVVSPGRGRGLRGAQGRGKRLEALHDHAPAGDARRPERPRRQRSLSQGQIRAAGGRGEGAASEGVTMPQHVSLSTWLSRCDSWGNCERLGP